MSSETNNLRHWEALGKTDPKHTKGFNRAGGFKGTAIKPMWSLQRMTEHFGPVGIGWGTEKPDFTTVNTGDEILVYCTVALWYLDPSQPDAEFHGLQSPEHSGVSMGSHFVYGVGGDKALIKGNTGSRTSDEAFKAAYTDALSNAMKQIGVGADVHMGLFDDHKYVREMEQEFAEQTDEPKKTNGASHSPVKAATSSVKLPEGFFDRESYEIPISERLPVSKWDAWFKAAIDGCQNEDTLTKLVDDNTRQKIVWEKSANPDVVEAVRKKLVDRSQSFLPGLTP